MEELLFKKEKRPFYWRPLFVFKWSFIGKKEWFLRQLDTMFLHINKRVRSKGGFSKYA